MEMAPPPGVVPDIDLDMVMTRRFDLVDQIEEAGKRHKVELASLTEELQLCEAFIKKTMLDAKTQQHKSATTGHETHFVTKTQCTVSDMDAVIDLVLKTAPPADILPDHSLWPAILDHIHKTGMWVMLTNAVSKETAKEYVKIHNAPPPGVKFREYRDLAWTRGK